jgi:hypothetical protein
LRILHLVSMSKSFGQDTGHFAVVQAAGVAPVLATGAVGFLTGSMEF